MSLSRGLRAYVWSPLLAGALVVSALALPASAGPASPRPQPSRPPVTSWPVNGPSQLRGSLSLSPAGELALAVSRRGATVVTASTLGIVTPDGSLATGLTFRRTSSHPIAEKYTMVTGKQAERRYSATETLFSFTGASGAALELAFRISDDGVAYRYTLPEKRAHTVTGESGHWTFPSDGAAWNQDGYTPNYEAEWTQSTLAGNVVGNIGYPALFQVGTNYALVTESNLTGQYSGSHLTHPEGSLSYGIGLYRDVPVTSDGPLTTPWRTAILGDLDTVVESTLVDDLAQPSQIKDTSWIAPGVSSWSWLTDSGSPRNEARQRDFVDLSARNGWQYVLLDEGWSADWVPRVTRYANGKGVDTIVWFHSNDLQTQAQRDHWLPLLKEWGVKGIKVDFMDSDSQGIHQWYSAIAADTARNHLMINFHGATLPRGLQRTWPNIMAYEAVRGQENGVSPQRSVILPFTRSVVGSMDFTPGVLSRGNANASKAQELAMSVVYESGWQHASDNPESYAAEPAAEQFLQNLPTTWDETTLISGTPGSSVVEARRSGDTWFIAGMRAGAGDPMTVPLDLLGHGRWLVHTLTDQDGNGSILGSGLSERTARETLTLPTATNGGFVVVACPARHGRTSCYEPVQPTAAVEVSVQPHAAGDLVVGDTITVTASAVVTDGEARAVSFGPHVPAGWTMEGAPVTSDRLVTGDTVHGAWTLTVGASTVRGDLEIAVGADYTSGGRHVFASDAVTTFIAPDAPTATTYISDIPTWLQNVSGYAANQRDLSMSGTPISLRGTQYSKGVGAHAPSLISVWAGAQCTVFTAVVGTDDNAGKPEESSAGFRVLGDGLLLSESPVLRATSDPYSMIVDVTGVKKLTLETTDGGDGKNNDHTDWADAKVYCGGDPGPAVPPEAAGPTGSPFVSDLPWTGESNGYGPIERDRSNGEAGAADGSTLTVAGQAFAKGVGMHATGALSTWLGRSCEKFDVVVGIDDDVLPNVGSVNFQVYGDGLLLAESGVLTAAGGSVPLSVDVSAVRTLTLRADEATNGKNYDHADWANAHLTCGA